VTASAFNHPERLVGWASRGEIILPRDWRRQKMRLHLVHDSAKA
jgi:hypothetical protein